MSENMKSNDLVGSIFYAISFAILAFLLIQDIFRLPRNEILNISLAIVAFVLLGTGYFLRRKLKKAETKQTAT